MNKSILISAIIAVIAVVGCTHYAITQRPEAENIINAPIDLVWKNTLQVLQNERIDAVAVDEETYSIKGDKRITLWSWGDDIVIRLLPKGDNQTNVYIEARAKAQLVGWGHQKRMVKDIFKKIKETSER